MSASLACIVCGKAPEPPVYSRTLVRDGWALLEGIYDSSQMLVCAMCKSVYAVGLDGALAIAGEPPLSWSVACAFALHVGQYEDAAQANGWDRSTASPEERGWRSAEFTAPWSLGMYGFGRWSDVRRNAANRDLLERMYPTVTMTP